MRVREREYRTRDRRRSAGDRIHPDGMICVWHLVHDNIKIIFHERTSSRDTISFPNKE